MMRLWRTRQIWQTWQTLSRSRWWTKILWFGLTLLTVLITACRSDWAQSLSANAVAQRPPSADSASLGTNLSSVNDWSTALPFIDAFKSSRAWIAQCESGDPGCRGNWSTEEALDLDEHGWVKSLPAPNDPPETTRAGTLLFREIKGQYPGGQYLVLYEGEGTIVYKFDAQKDEAASRPGRDVINVTPSDGGIFLQITATDPRKTGDYIRNIRVIPAAFEQTYQTEIFNPLFLERIGKFQALRFMDWMNTNNSEQRDWSDRAQVEDASYALGKGVPIEIMLALANRLKVAPWFNLPHQATDDYITQFAQLVRDRLDRNLPVYIELSNEVWNWQFPQAHYASEQGKARWGDKGDAFMQWYGMRTAQMSDIWKTVFGEARDRVVSVMGTQTAWYGLETSALDCSLWVAEGNKPCYQHQIDAFAIAGYFSGNLNQDDAKPVVEAWAQEGEAGFSKAIEHIKTGGRFADDGFDDSLPGVAKSFAHYHQIAADRGLQLVVYEGGQHLVRPDSEPLTNFFIALNKRPEMHDLYKQLLQVWQEQQGTLFMNFSDVVMPSKWGSWGALEYIEQTSSPKYDALMEFLDR